MRISSSGVVEREYNPGIPSKSLDLVVCQTRCKGLQAHQDFWPHWGTEAEGRHLTGLAKEPPARVVGGRKMKDLGRPATWLEMAGASQWHPEGAKVRIHPVVGPEGQCFALTLDRRWRSEEHTSELQSPLNLVCRL